VFKLPSSPPLSPANTAARINKITRFPPLSSWSAAPIERLNPDIRRTSADTAFIPSDSLPLASVVMNPSTAKEQVEVPSRKRKKLSELISSAIPGPQPKKTPLGENAALSSLSLSWPQHQIPSHQHTPVFAAIPANSTCHSPINQQDEEGNTLLMTAILYKDIAKAWALFTPSVNPNLQNKKGNTILILALKLGYIHLAREIIYHPSTNIFLVNKEKENAFAYLKKLPSNAETFFLGREMYVIYAQQMPVESLNTWQEDQITPLCFAAATHNLYAIQILLQRGADPNIPNSYGNTPLMLAIRHGHIPEAAELIAVTKNLDQQNQEKDTALMLAIRLGYVQIARELIRYPINIFLLNKNQENAFLLLAQQGYSVTYQHCLLTRDMLIISIHRYPFFLNQPIDGSNTLLHLAAKLGEISLLQQLLAKGANLYIPNQEGNTPLMLAIEQNHLFIANLLTALPPKIDQQNRVGDTALMLAIRLNHIEIARSLATRPYLLNIFSINQQGDSAFSLFFQYRTSYTPQESILATNILTYAANSVSSERIDDKVDGNNTLLCLAVILMNMLIARRLLDKGANLNKPNNQGNTPIMLAIKQKQLEMTYFLLSRHPDLSWQNLQKETAYTLALENGWDSSLLQRLKGSDTTTLPTPC
jgi:ankyrin repeat protein